MTAYEMRISDWRSDVCSSVLADVALHLDLRGVIGQKLDTVDPGHLSNLVGDRALTGAGLQHQQIRPQIRFIDQTRNHLTGSGEVAEILRHHDVARQKHLLHAIRCRLLKQMGLGLAVPLAASRFQHFVGARIQVATELAIEKKNMTIYGRVTEPFEDLLLALLS